MGSSEPLITQMEYCQNFTKDDNDARFMEAVMTIDLDWLTMSWRTMLAMVGLSLAIPCMVTGVVVMGMKLSKLRFGSFSHRLAHVRLFFLI